MGQRSSHCTRARCRKLSRAAPAPRWGASGVILEVRGTTIQPFFTPVLRTGYFVSLGTAFIDFTIQNCSNYELLGDSENKLRY